MSKKTEFLIVFLFFTIIILFLTLSGYTFLGIQDEVQLQATLSLNDPKNYMTSYPFAVLVGTLYSYLPNIPWYGIAMLFYIWLTTLLMSIYIVLPNYQNKFVKYTLLVLFTLLLLYMLWGVGVTSLMLILIVMAIPLIRIHQGYFWLLLWIASFLREELIFSILPLLILAYFLNIQKSSFSRKKVLLIPLFSAAILFNHFSCALDKEYKEWLDFTTARLYFTDLTGMDEKNILTEDEYQLSKTWWICDLDLYPSKKIPEAAGTTLDVAKEKIFLKEHFLKRLFAIPYHHPVIIFLALLTLYIVYLEKSSIRRVYYLLFGIGFAMLLLVKDVERVTFPLLLLWWTILILELLRDKRERLLVLSMPILILFVASQTPWHLITEYQKNEKLVQEFKELIEKKQMQL
ncbi:MAG TPA: hypothetical protein ENK77_03380, partial [Epsilonproteobacteria bacterium]|nr:hypothetical protein [Campylobacterota bacterium]